MSDVVWVAAVGSTTTALAAIVPALIARGAERKRVEAQEKADARAARAARRERMSVLAEEIMNRSAAVERSTDASTVTMLISSLRRGAVLFPGRAANVCEDWARDLARSEWSSLSNNLESLVTYLRDLIGDDVD